MIVALRPRRGFDEAAGDHQRPSGPGFSKTIPMMILLDLPRTRVKLLPLRLQQLLALYPPTYRNDFRTELPQQTANFRVVPDT